MSEEASLIDLPGPTEFDYGGLGTQQLPPRVQTIVMGLGAARCGTTWLHRALTASRKVHRAPAKELHFWDQFNRMDVIKYADIAQKSFEDAYARLWWAEKIPLLGRLTIREVHARRLRMASYRGTLHDRLRAYTQFLQVGYSGQTHLADITPYYGRVDAEVYRAMDALHPDVRYIFMMRDPVDRIWSSFTKSEWLSEDGPTAISARMHDRARSELETQAALNFRASRYDLSLQAMRDAGIQDKTLVLYFEELFLPETQARIADFLSLPPLEADTGKQINASPFGKINLDPSVRAEMRTVLRPAYEAAEDFMGYVPDKWRPRDR